MPYIENKIDRDFLDEKVKEMLAVISMKGNLNYFLFKLFKEMELRYGTARNFFGEVECAKFEIYRRMIAPYEDKKIGENGDVD